MGITMQYIKPTRISLKNHSELNEKWVQDRIAENPSILGLGKLILKDKERIQAGSGRLDLLFQDSEDDHRYEVEIQLGKTDESHIIRTIEYWDIERKRYPRYEHTAVIVAEDITSRFLNVIGLFNGSIPLIAIQMQAFQTNDILSLVFTTVLKESQLGFIDEDEGPEELTNRAYWEDKSSKDSLAIVDLLFETLKSIDSNLSLNYMKNYIGLMINKRANNFVVFHPKKRWVRVGVRLERSNEIQAKLDEAELDLMEYDHAWGKYRIRMTKDDAQKHESLTRELFKSSYEQSAH